MGEKGNFRLLKWSYTKPQITSLRYKSPYVTHEKVAYQGLENKVHWKEPNMWNRKQDKETKHRQNKV